MIRKLIKFLGEYKKFALLSPLLVLVEVVCELMMPYLMSRIIDVGIKNADIGYITKIGMLMVGLAILAIITGCANTFASSKAATGFSANLRRGIFGKIQEFSFANIDKFSTASLVTRMTNDVNTLQMTIMMTLRILLRAPMMLVFALGIAISLNAQLAVVLAYALPVLAIAVIIIMPLAGKLFTRMQKSLDALNSTVQENLIGIRVVKAIVREKFEKSKFEKSNEELFSASVRASRLVIFIMPIMMLVLNFSTILVIWRGGNMVSSGIMGTGELISFISYIFQILMSLMMVSMVLLMAARSKASGTRVLEVLDTRVDIVNKPGEDDPQVTQGRVAFKNVSFKYSQTGDGEDVLHNINFTAEPGKVYAIVGATGSAKSTLVSLIARLYDVSSGSLEVDGVDVRDYKLETLRGAIGMVLQNNVLFSGTIRDNLLWGNAQATKEQLEAATKNAQAHEFIMAFSKGYDTELEQGGVNVSGGQKQRLCIARAMLKKPAILILDDSTSAVDSATESKIRQSFRENLADTTVFIIAQRISSVQEADCILVLDDGSIVGEGTHEELLQTNQVYREIYNSQQEGVVA